MLNRIIEIVKREDKKNPFTDREIAAQLGVSREIVTELRVAHNIPNSRERRKDKLFNDGRRILKKEPQISERQFLKLLKEEGYKVSRHVASELKKEVMKELKLEGKLEEKAAGNVEENVEENVKKKVFSDFSSNEPENCFKEIIGSEYSLKIQINQAKAAVLYPPNGLHTLILGPSGSGKSQLAEMMYKFALCHGTLSKDANFIVFNCADYADNPHLLLSQLFGHAKGAFTGADSSKEGLVERANGGILFLDEVHRLPKEGQEILFYIFDKGIYRRLGEVTESRKVDLMIIAATTENPESSLLLTFRRRIPMMIELPSLNKRTFIERFELIKKFFSQEATRIGRKILVKKHSLRILMIYECAGNIGQLRSDIQVSCARGLLNSIGERKKAVTIGQSDLAGYVRDSFLKNDKRYPEIEKFIVQDISFLPNKAIGNSINNDRYMLSEKIYQFIEERYELLKTEGSDSDEVNMILGREVKSELEKFAKSISDNRYISRRDLEGIVGKELINVVDEAFDVAKRNIKNIKENFYYTLAVHLSATYDRIKKGKPIINPQLKKIKEEYKKEYAAAVKITNSINSMLDIELPEDETGFIAMYLRTFSCETQSQDGRVGIIVLTHGQVATAMVEVANRLLGVHHAVGIEMSLDESPESALEKAIEAVKKIDTGKGCLILVDMGSLVTFGEIITQRTGIKTKIVGRVDTVMVLEAVRRALISDTELDEIAEALDGDKSYVGKVIGTKKLKTEGLPKAIVTLCITGNGTAAKIKKYIEDYVRESRANIDIIPIGVISNQDLNTKIYQIREKYEVIAFVGTINPDIFGIPFIPFHRLLNGTGIQEIKSLVRIKSKDNPLEKLIKLDLIKVNLDFYTKNDVLDYLIELLTKKGFVNSEFMLSVYKREAMADTYAKGGIAIPHGFPEKVVKPAVVIASLKKPIIWSGDKKVEIVFLIAYKSDSKDLFKNFYKVITNMNALSEIKNAEAPEKIKNIILNQTR